MSQTYKRLAAAAVTLDQTTALENPMIRTLLAAALLTAAGAVFAQANRVASLDWMAGNWAQETGKEKVMEAWVGPGNGLMAAVNLTTMPGGRKTFEFLRIADTADSMSYFASPGGRPPVEFRFKESGDKRVVFENLGHDYPQRIIYWKDGDLLAARIEGNVRGNARAEEWKLSPVRPASGGGSGG
jgi:hypothetical protein